MSKVSDLPLTTTPSTAIKLYASNAGVDEALTVETLLGGFSGGKALYGGTASGEHLDLFASEHATPGMVRIGGSSGAIALDQVNARIGLGTLAPAVSVHVQKSAGARIRLEDTDGGADEKNWDLINDDGVRFILRPSSDAGSGGDEIRLIRSGTSITEMRIGGTTGTAWRLDLSDHLMAQPVPTSEPADSEFITSQAIIYGDEANDQLKVKWKKSDDTFVKGNMSGVLA